MNKTGIIILAAGNSSRLGRPKQLLQFRGKTLISHVVAEAVVADLQPVVVVTGAYHAEISDALRGLAVTLVYNPHWEIGMASGIAAGMMKTLYLAPGLQAVVVAVSDQPYISAELFRSLVQQQAVSGKGIIACTYAETRGTPVLFAARYFNGLAALRGEAGARQLLKQYPDEVAAVPFLQGEVDIDTEEDFRQLRE